MEYYYQIEGSKRNNIGDVLQGMVAKAFLPDNCLVADRENLADIPKTAPSFFIANGWYMHSFENFPPPENVNPLYISMHIANSQLLADANIRAHFLKHSPIGCRDKKTLKLFLGWGIPSYYSGCLTTTTNSRDSNNSKNGEVLLVDNVDHPVPAEVKKKLEKLLGKPLVSISHDPPKPEGDFVEYTKKAEAHMNSLLTRYCQASMVVTTKIHCALPCLGMGVKVLMVHPHPDEGRLGPLAEFIDIISYDEVMKSETISVPSINQSALEKRKSILKKIVTESVKVGHNAVSDSNDKQLKMLRLKSRVMASTFRFGLLTMYRMGIAKDKIERVYGAGL